MSERAYQTHNGDAENSFSFEAPQGASYPGETGIVFGGEDAYSGSAWDLSPASPEQGTISPVSQTQDAEGALGQPEFVSYEGAAGFVWTNGIAYPTATPGGEEIPDPSSLLNQ